MRILASLLLFILRGVGRAILSIINVTIGLLCIGGIVAALANYTMTQGSGTTFASVVISTVHYAAMVVCDATVGTTQCAAVDASGNQAVKDAAVLSALNTAGLCQAFSSEPAAATTNNPVKEFCDLVGKSVTSPYANRENMLRCAVTITASTAATTCTGMGAQGASVKIYITDLCVTRNDAGTTADTFTLNDTATTVIDIPNNGGGGGICKTYNVPLVVAANTAFQGTSGTSITSLHMSATGFAGY
jgi:hypothetical protein